MKTKSLLFLTIFTFYLGNIYHSGIRDFLWNAKFAMLILLVAFLLFSSQRIKNQPDKLLSSIYALFGAFFGIVLFQLFLYDFGPITYYFDKNYGIKLLLGFFISIVCANYVARYFSDFNRQQEFIDVLVNIARLVTYSAFLFFLAGLNLGRGAEGSSRFSGWTDNPNTLGVMLLASFPIVLHRAITNQGYEARLLVLLMIFIAILTGSRGAVFGMAISGLIVFWFFVGKSRWLYLVFGITIFPILVLELNIFDMIQNIPTFARSEENIMSGRDEVWALGFTLFKEQPWFGYGFGAEGGLLELYQQFLIHHQGFNVHNSYLSLLMMVGLLGSLPLFFVLTIALKTTVGLMTNISGSRKNDIFSIFMTSIVLSSLTHGFFETWLFSPGNMNNFIFWMAVFWLFTPQRKPEIGAILNKGHILIKIIIPKKRPNGTIYT